MIRPLRFNRSHERPVDRTQRVRFACPAFAFSLALALVLAFAAKAETEPAAADAEESETRVSIMSRAPESLLLSPYDGHWQRIEDSDHEQERLQNIEASMAELSWIVRKMAAGVLKKSTVPPVEMRFTWDGQQLLQTTEGQNGNFERPVVLDGEPIQLTDARGEDFTSQWTWTERGLQVSWKQHQAYGTNVYSIDPEDRTLRVEHMIKVTAISDIAPIVFRSRFSRNAPPHVSASARSGAEARP